jgi:hypothetical protein
MEINCIKYEGHPILKACGVRLAILQFEKIGRGHGLRLEKFEIWSLNGIKSSSLIFQS